jgi:hypothetical protein
MASTRIGVKESDLHSGVRPAISTSMKMLGLACVAMVLAGCAESPYAHDPRAAVVGPAYLDYIAEYPPDRATQLYYPSFALRDMAATTGAVVPFPVPPHSAVDALIVERPAESKKVQEITGTGFPDLESTGIRVFTSAQP